MDPPAKRCRLCLQPLPTLPQLPLEIIDEILSLLPFELHVAVVGASGATRRRALRRPDRFAHCADAAIAAHWAVEADDPARAHLGALCRFACARAAQQFFNERVPRGDAARMLNAPRAASDGVLARRWAWWRLARALLEHEATRGRGRRPSRVRVDEPDCAWADAPISDASPFEFDAQPDAMVVVTLNDEPITLYMCGGRAHRLV